MATGEVIHGTALLSRRMFLGTGTLMVLCALGVLPSLGEVLALPKKAGI